MPAQPMPHIAPIRRKITLNDIAAGCDVSRATVSLVLRGSPLVNKDTRTRIKAELARQGYIYNRAAANLRRRTASSIALVLNDLGNPYFAEFASGVDAALGETGFVMLLGSTGESPSREQAVLASLAEHAPGGIILSPAEGADAAQVFRAAGAHMPLLLFNREPVGIRPEGAHWDVLVLDNRRGAAIATAHLIERGHRRIAFFGGHRDSSTCAQRCAGYLDAMREADLPAPPAWQIECGPTRMEAARHTDALFAIDAPPTAAVCYNDAVALGLMLGLYQRDLMPGRDFALTGFDDIAEAALGQPPLTTLSTDPRARGRQAAELLIERIGNPLAPGTRTVAPVQLQIRATSPPPRH